MAFKDIFEKEIQVGDHIIYIQSWADKNIEEAIVTRCEKEFIVVEYLGIGSPPKYQWNNKKQAGKKSRFTVTEKKVIIITPLSSDDNGNSRNIFNEERKRFEQKTKKFETMLAQALDKENKLKNEIELLQAEVDRIHNRWSILDL